MAKLSLKTLRRKTGIRLVSADVPKAGTLFTYKALEKRTESKTHREMREYGTRYFQRLGYRVYPEAVGVEGVFTFADFLAVRDQRVVFVECLTDRNLVEEVLRRKKALQAFGEMCFIVVGGHGCEWVYDERERSRLADRLSREIDVLEFHYGHWQNGFKKRVKGVTYFPRVCFDVAPGEQLSVGADFLVKKTTVEIVLQFVSMAHLREDKAEFLRDLGFWLSWEVFEKRKARVRDLRPLGKSRPLIFRNEMKGEIARLQVTDRGVNITARGGQGAKVVRWMFNRLPSLGLAGKYKSAELESAIAGLGAAEFQRRLH